MKLLIALSLLATVVFAFEQAEECSSSVCQLDDECVCASGTAPLSLSDTPQVIYVEVVKIHQ